jgi:hypothetical protein
MLFDGKVTYLKWPMPWRHDAVWLRYEDEVSDVDPLDLRDRATRNPIGLLAFLTGASNDVREVGQDDVCGTRTTHYEGTLDLQTVVNQAPPDQRAELQEALSFIAEDEPTTGGPRCSCVSSNTHRRDECAARRRRFASAGG